MTAALPLEGALAVVTGAGRGLGLASARALASAGADVVLLARTAAQLEPAAAAVAAEHGRRAVAIPTDVTSAAEVGAAFERVAELGTPSVLVNAAGATAAGQLHELGDDAWSAVLDVNLTGTFLCCRAFAALAGPGSSIVNVGSLAGTVGVRTELAYSASKAGVEGLSRSMALELARRGIRVNVLAPGYFATELSSAVVDDPDQLARLVRRIPLGRVGQPDEIGPPVVFLASSASAYMTGAVLRFDGGYTAQ